MRGPPFHAPLAATPTPTLPLQGRGRRRGGRVCEVCGSPFSHSSPITGGRSGGGWTAAPTVCGSCGSGRADRLSMLLPGGDPHPGPPPAREREKKGGRVCEVCGSPFSHSSPITGGRSGGGWTAAPTVCGSCGSGRADRLSMLLPGGDPHPDPPPAREREKKGGEGVRSVRSVRSVRIRVRGPPFHAPRRRPPPRPSPCKGEGEEGERVCEVCGSGRADRLSMLFPGGDPHPGPPPAREREKKGGGREGGGPRSRNAAEPSILRRL